MSDSLLKVKNFKRRLLIACHAIPCGYLAENHKNEYSFTYLEDYRGPPVSLTMPVRIEPYLFDHFPPFFDGLLPEGAQLEALIRQNKIDSDDYMSQLEVVGADLVGAVTVTQDPKINQEGV